MAREFRPGRLAQNCCPGSGARHFFYCTFSHKMPFVPVLRRGIFPLHSRIKWLFCSVQVHFDCAGSHKTVVPSPDPGARHFSGQSSHNMALATCPCACRLRRLVQNGCPCEKILWRSCWNHKRCSCMILYRSLRKDLVGILMKCGPSMVLYRPLWEDLEVKSCGCPCMACFGPSEKIFWNSCSNPPWEGLH